MKAMLWCLKFDGLKQSVKELQRRNDLLASLLDCIRNRKLTEPFNKHPPRGQLQFGFPKSISLHLDESSQLQINETKSILKLKSSKSNLVVSRQNQHELLLRSPDSGAFLLHQPVPENGTFCYLTIASHRPSI